MLSRAVVFPLVTADAALGCGGPRKANDPRDLGILKPSYPLILRKNQNYHAALEQMTGDIQELAQSLPIEKLAHLIKTQYQGLVQQLISMPPDIMIEYWLFDDYPDLRPYQQMSLQRQQIEAIKGLDFQISRIVPVKIVAASNTMNYCFFRLVGMHLGQNLVSPYNGSVYINRGKELAEITTREYRNDYLGDIAMVNRWAAFFELQDWFTWTSFEDVPPNYLDTV